MAVSFHNSPGHPASWYLSSIGRPADTAAVKGRCHSPRSFLLLWSPTVKLYVNVKDEQVLKVPRQILTCISISIAAQAARIDKGGRCKREGQRGDKGLCLDVQEMAEERTVPEENGSVHVVMVDLTE